MGYILNTTDDYHRHALNTLGWELTVCNALDPEKSPCRSILKSNASFGEHLFNFLRRHVPFNHLKHVLEVGGGLGYLMRDFLSLAPHLQATMLDISPVLLQKQKETLAGFPASFREMDFLHMPVSDLRGFDLAIFNENIGDFPTLVFDESFPENTNQNTVRSLQKKADYEEEFSLDFTPAETINIGALEILEKLCGADIPYIYLSEHSCESFLHNPYYPHHNFEACGTPEKISLRGHNEYTVKFSHLETIARAFRYRVFRGQYIDILPIGFNQKVQSALRCTSPLNDEQEMIQQFVHDLYKYEYLLLIHQSIKKG